MNKEEITNYIEEQIDYHCDEFGLAREEVTDVVLLNCIEHFYRDALSEDDLIECANYLKYEINMNDIGKEKQRSKRATKKE